ncbi:hypothetical protein [uncultured Mediterranean phage]|nr:hypothetical protein [uncultured Mediterranean phage]
MEIPVPAVNASVSLVLRVLPPAVTVLHVLVSVTLFVIVTAPADSVMLMPVPAVNASVSLVLRVLPPAVTVRHVLVSVTLFVIVTAPADSVMLTPVPAVNASVSPAPSVLPPAVTVLNVLVSVTVLVNVIWSAVVAMEIPVPATSVRVSSSASATTSDSPDTTMVLNEYSLASPPPLWLIVSVSPTIAVEMFVPPAIVRVSPGVIAVEPESLVTVRSDTTKSMSPVPSWYVIVIPVLVPPVDTSGPAKSSTSSWVSVSVIATHAVPL